jgi:cleavage and polyadenylation specificity factor subunit 1
VESVIAPPSHDILAASKDTDDELRTLQESNTALGLEKLQVPGTTVSIYCDLSAGMPRPYVPASLRLQVFRSIHPLHSVLCGPAYRKIAAPGRELVRPASAQKSSATFTPVGDFTLPPARFLHVNIDLIGPLPTSAGSTYCLTAVDRFTRWPEAIPIPNITAETVARALLIGWISSFGCSQTIITDQRCQFESQLFYSIAILCGIQLSRTTAYHPAANGLVECFHRTLKAAIMCHADQHWTEALPLVLLGIRSSFKADLYASSAELVYGEPLRIPGQFLTQTTHPVEPTHLITQLRQHMARLRSVIATRHARPETFVYKDLYNCTNVFLRQDTTRQALEPPYSGPYQVISRKEKTLRLLV